MPTDMIIVAFMQSLERFDEIFRCKDEEELTDMLEDIHVNSGLLLKSPESRAHFLTRLREYAQIQTR